MALKIVGWLAIFIGMFSLAPSVVPGAMSAIGWFISIFALIVASVSVKSGSYFYLKVVTVIYGIGALFFNDGSRLYLANPNATLAYKSAVYLVLITFTAIILYNKKSNKNKS
ncbi:hypothetical protein SG34_012875 [Thalassomonas viridans]|uniref:Uncharacterized protein n=1 Tax=Thalassomonas viridans TaxID=137584 RepID=A0AAE9Z9C5_9GAMM|nr:hypothetical protein [Thalassomonas viridans]WDE07703.1 hypothetical protein SG34_012875 [Thalassomonas viridans]